MRARKLAVFLVVAVLAALASPARGVSLEKPSLTVGDFWTYRTDTSFEVGFELQGQVTSVVSVRESTRILGVWHDVFRIVLNGSGTVSGQVAAPMGTGSVTGTWILTGEELLETNQLKVVSNVLDLSVDGLFRGVVPFSIRATNTTLYRVLLDGWRFPIAAGSSGTVQYAYNYTQDFFAFGNQTRSSGSGNLTLEYLMGGATNVATPAGNFASYPVQETWPDGTIERAYFSPALGNDARTETYNETGVLVSTTVLQSYRYQVLEPALLLGLTLVGWSVLIAIIAGAALAGFLLWRRSRKKRVLPPSLRNPPS